MVLTLASPFYLPVLASLLFCWRGNRITASQSWKECQSSLSQTFSDYRWGNPANFRRLSFPRLHSGLQGTVLGNPPLVSHAVAFLHLCNLLRQGSGLLRLPPDFLSAQRIINEYWAPPCNPPRDCFKLSTGTVTGNTEPHTGTVKARARHKQTDHHCKNPLGFSL